MVLLGLQEVLYWDEIPPLKSAIHSLLEQYHPNAGNFAEYEKARDAFYTSSIHGKEDFRRRIDNYKRNGRPVWVSGRIQWINDIAPEDLKRAFRYVSPERGRELAERPRGSWAEAYAARVLGDAPQRILELTVGAGGGTGAVAANMREQDAMIGVDIDFLCAKNADAIGRYYGVDLLGICCNLWELPFEDGSFSVVCCVKGLNECREIPTILREAARVLMPGGRMVMVLQGRTGYAYRSLFNLFGIGEEEGLSYLRDARLYSTPEDLEKTLKPFGVLKTYEQTLKNGDVLVEYAKTGEKGQDHAL